MEPTWPSAEQPEPHREQRSNPVNLSHFGAWGIQAYQVYLSCDRAFSGSVTDPGLPLAASGTGGHLPPECGSRRPAPSLPRALRPLFGRETEISEGCRLLGNPAADGTSTVVVTGPPGIGKSAVALGLSQRVADAYPDGQFHIDLALSWGEGKSADLMLAVLHALRPDGGPVPDGRPQQLALLRRTLSHNRVLLLIDDVPSEESLLELLRLDGPFGLVCTSRAKLSGLTGLVRLIELEPLPPRYSEELVREVAGPDRLTGIQVSSLAEACAGHPLALHVAAAHLARRPKVNVDRFLDEITDPERGVRALKAGQTALEPVLETSFAALSPEQEHLFTTLGALPHMSLTTEVAAVAAAASLDEFAMDDIDAVTDLLDSLFELSLIEQIDEDRYVLHDILHRFARLKSASTEPERREAVVRQACLALAIRVKSATESIGFLDKEAKVPSPGNADALRSLDADRPGAVALTEMARQHALWDPLVRLATELTSFLRHGSHWTDLGRVYECVLEAGARAGQPDWTATAQHNLATVAAHLGDSQKATDLLHASAMTGQEADNPYQMFLAMLALGGLLINLGRCRDAIPFLRQGLPFWRLTEDRQVLAQALGNLGQAHMAIGKLRRAERYLRNSQNLARAGSPADLSNRGAIAALLRRTGRMAEAARNACQDIERARAVGSRDWEARALSELAEIPADEHPESAPSEPLEAALAIYRDTGDVQGQVRTLFRLGDRAAGRADIHQAAERLGECAELAHQIGDYEHAARSLVYLATYYGSIGRLEDAEAYFENALDMARQIGNPGVLAEALQKRAKFLWHLGHVGRAVDLLSEAARHLETTDEKQALAQIRAALGEALIVAGRWQEGAETLQSVISVMSSHASPATRVRALRGLAVLYSRRGLHAEAMSTVTKALDQCERADDTSGMMDCRMALGNVHARNGKWAEALEQYDKAAEIAREQWDLHVALAARSQAAACRLSSGEKEQTEQAVASIAELIPLAQRLGMKGIEAALRANLGAHHAEAGAGERAVTEFRAALSLSEQVDDRPMHAACLLNLARAYHRLGDTALSRSHARRAFSLHHELGEWRQAGVALLHLGLVHHEASPDAASPTFEDLLGEGQRVDARVMEAVRSHIDRPRPRAEADPGPTADSPSPLADTRRINVSEAVMRALSGIDLESLMTRLGNSRQTCEACNLLIDETGEAELLLLRHPEIQHVVLRLAHPHCALSQVMQLRGPAPRQPRETSEVECILFGQTRAGIIADWYGGWGSLDGNDKVEDLVLKAFLDMGFVSLRNEPEREDGHVLDFSDLPPMDNSGVKARLEDNKLSISGPHGCLLPPIPINFYPRWYRRALEGSLIVVVGRNLQGMTADDPSYFLRAIDLGHVVGATVPLTVVRPSRNSTCPCMMRTGRKFKDCCGRSSA
ncbi:tetratricopeptide repeat protein [Streptomyces sp. MBT67]|uniref:tetratricopeptide repeat protein n=1 Tax=unclassified Streptomyces TaxID=2593676 RepID=UPI00190A7F98|nr:MULTISPECIES: tetratricopeptide repeat protein [unclassified Streptomyces]MBK3532071.1 tetratricopeptide repeat protein [Streptomyces sp. MBT72]MBK3539846.1 tetratricopeptide repeat protein [Streptomyces sp. MBT67]MBK3551380.1 tetratricopeptide repeat protein [Streptomyces sp. MBT61]MBK6032103.1 tetratricopeptide repeat protein [Streptomyces sp. MBT59]